MTVLVLVKLVSMLEIPRQPRATACPVRVKAERSDTAWYTTAQLQETARRGHVGGHLFVFVCN